MRPLPFKQLLNDCEFVTAADHAVLMYDLDQIERRIALVRDLLPGGLHTYAVKACPLPKLLQMFVAHGFGLEVASHPELALGLNTGCDPQRVVYDSPVRTREELADALRQNVIVNLNTLAEVERVAVIDPATVHDGQHIGLRINPLVGVGTIDATSVATSRSKFGEPITNRESILRAFERHRWLSGLHMHIGSQGQSPEQFEIALDRLCELTACVERRRGEPLRFIDVGGGVPVRYDKETEDSQAGFLTFEEYARHLSDPSRPWQLAGTQLVTECGRWYVTNAGTLVSRVELARDLKGNRQAAIHVGADFAVRECYRPDQWPHRFSVLDSSGNARRGDSVPHDIFGPLCFSGDRLATDLRLPIVHENDWIAMHDVGGYTLGMWSRYNSRPMPLVVGYRRAGDSIAWTLLKPRESVDDVLRFWNG